MSKITNVRGHSLQIAETGIVVEPDETVDVDEALAASLLDQPDNWRAATPAKTKTDKENTP